MVNMLLGRAGVVSVSFSVLCLIGVQNLWAQDSVWERLLPDFPGRAVPAAATLRNARQSDDLAFLSIGANRGYVELVRSLLAEGVSPHEGYNGVFQLQWALMPNIYDDGVERDESSTTAIVQALLEAGADPSRFAAGSAPPIIAAIAYDHFEALEAIVATPGFDLDAKIPSGETTALSYAAESCKADRAARPLLRAGADVDDVLGNPIIYVVRSLRENCDDTDLIAGLIDRFSERYEISQEVVDKLPADPDRLRVRLYSWDYSSFAVVPADETIMIQASGPSQSEIRSLTPHEFFGFELRREGQYDVLAYRQSSRPTYRGTIYVAMEQTPAHVRRGYPEGARTGRGSSPDGRSAAPRSTGSIRVCAGDVPPGAWVLIKMHSSGNGGCSGFFNNTWEMRDVSGAPIGSEELVCVNSPRPDGWEEVDRSYQIGRCRFEPSPPTNMKRIRRVN